MVGDEVIARAQPADGDRAVTAADGRGEGRPQMSSVFLQRRRRRPGSGTAPEVVDNGRLLSSGDVALSRSREGPSAHRGADGRLVTAPQL